MMLCLLFYLFCNLVLPLLIFLMVKSQWYLIGTLSIFGMFFWYFFAWGIQ